MGARGTTSVDSTRAADDMQAAEPSDELAQARERLQALLDADVDPRVVLDPVRDQAGSWMEVVITAINPAALGWLGRSGREVIGGGIRDLLPQRTHRVARAVLERVLRTGEPYIRDHLSVHCSLMEAERFLDLRAVRAGTGVIVTWRDVTEVVLAQRALAQSEARYRLLAENASDVVLQTLSGTMTWLSPSLQPALGWRPDEWIGHALEDFTHPEDVARLQMRRADISQGQASLFRIRLRGIDGDHHWVEIHAGPNIDPDGCNVGITAAFRIIDDQVEAERQREHLARFDSLTGLMNRAEVVQAVSDVVDQVPRTGSRVALLYCDVDRFKEINDEYGHAKGDFVLRTLGERIRECIRADDFAARIGGDEFLVVLTGLHDAVEAQAIAEKIRSLAAEPMSLNPAGTIRTGMSIGVALGRVGEPVDRFIERADLAMYRAKRGGRNVVST